MKGTKNVKVTYDWKPPLCSHCNVFGHDYKGCKSRVRTDEEITCDGAVAKKGNIEKENDFVQWPVRKAKNNSNMNNPEKYREGFNKNQNMDKSRNNAGVARQQWAKKDTNSGNWNQDRRNNVDKNSPSLNGANHKKASHLNKSN